MQYLKTIPLEQESCARREIRALQTIRHKNVPKLYAIRRYTGGYCLWMTYFPGYTLGELVRRGKHFTVDEVLKILFGICGIVTCMHAELPDDGEKKGTGSTKNQKDIIIHTDLHPDNLIISGDRLCIVDFGNSWCSGDSYDGETRQGTPGFAAPELYTGGPVDCTTDIFSVGKIILYLLDTVEDKTSDARYDRIFQIALGCTRLLPENRIQKVTDLLTLLRLI